MNNAQNLLAGKVAVVTGAGSGIGAAMARSLVSAGAKVAGLDVQEAGLAKTSEQLPSSRRGSFLQVVADISSPDACSRAIEKTVSALGPINILVNNAGLGGTYARPKDFIGRLHFWQADVERWSRTIAVNSIGPFLLAHLVTPAMIEAKWGRIVNVTTGFGTMVAAGRSAYGASKAALEASSAIWSKELADTGVTVNVIIPGAPTDTGIKGGMIDGLSSSDRTLLSPDIFAAPIRWLVSEQSNGITGYRFLAKDWDEKLDPKEAARKSSAPVAWRGAA